MHIAKYSINTVFLPVASSQLDRILIPHKNSLAMAKTKKTPAKKKAAAKKASAKKKAPAKKAPAKKAPPPPPQLTPATNTIPPDVIVRGASATALFTLTIYRGEGMCLIAMNW